MYEERCDHLTEGEFPQANSNTCDDCAKAGQTPVQLRICRTCGHVGCCDSSPGKHATAHFQESKHPIIQTFEPGDDWGWCYEHKKGIGPFPPAR